MTVSVLIGEREESQSRKRRCDSRSRISMSERLDYAVLLVLKLEEGPGSEECGQPLEAGKGRKWILPKSPQKGVQTC